MGRWRAAEGWEDLALGSPDGASLALLGAGFGRAEDGQGMNKKVRTSYQVTAAGLVVT